MPPFRRKRTVAKRRTYKKSVKTPYTRVAAVAKRQFNMRYKYPCHYFKRWLNAAAANGTLVGGSLATVGGGQNFVMGLTQTAGGITYGTFTYNWRMDDVPQFTEFTNLYDKYTCRGFVVKIMAWNTQSATGAAFVSDYGQSSLLIHHVIDRDDSILPAASEAGVNDLRQYPGYQVKNLVRQNVRRYVAPKGLVAMVNAASAVVGNASTGTRFWIDAAETDVPHYGFKAIFEGLSGGTSNVLGINIFIKIEVEAYIECKEPR